MDPQTGALTVLIFGFLLGLKHATDADHVVAVTTFVSRERNIWRSLWIGLYWGAGHSIPLFVIGTATLLFRESVLDRYESVATYFEIGVGVMLLYLGAGVIWNLWRRNVHVHHHDHGDGHHIHVHGSHQASESHEPTAEEGADAGSGQRSAFLRLKSFGIGIVHGLAGSAALLIALMPEIDSAFVGVLYLVLFSVGTMLSMSALTLLLAVPFAASQQRHSLNSGITLGAGALSIAIGAVVLTEIFLDTEIIPF